MSIRLRNDIIAGHRNGDNAHVILIGHSLGSNAVVQVADRLASNGIPVDLAVTFDITEGLRVPLNIACFINFYQNNGFGRPAVEACRVYRRVQQHQPVEPDAARSRQHRQRTTIAGLRHEQRVRDHAYACADRDCEEEEQGEGVASWSCAGLDPRIHPFRMMDCRVIRRQRLPSLTTMPAMNCIERQRLLFNHRARILWPHYARARR